MLTGAPSADLPRKLVPVRKACIKDCAKDDEKHSQAVNKLNADYFAALGRIQSTAPSGNTALLEQITMEKKYVLAGNIGPITNLHTQLNDKWNYTVSDNNTVTVHWNATSGVTIVLDKDGHTLFLNGKSDMTLVNGTDKNNRDFRFASTHSTKGDFSFPTKVTGGTRKSCLTSPYRW